MNLGVNERGQSQPLTGYTRDKTEEGFANEGGKKKIVYSLNAKTGKREGIRNAATRATAEENSKIFLF